MKRWLSTRQLAWGFERNGKPEAGYTITEVMIVLAVTATMFAAIVLVFSGRQARVEFNQAVREYEAALQNTMNGVATGFYQSKFQCGVTGTGPPTINNTPAEAGTNEGCIFLGKVLIPAGAPGTSSAIETLVGRRTAGGSDVETIQDAQPVVVESAASSFNHAFGLQIREIQNLDGGARLHGVGFLNQLARGGSLTDTEGDVSGGGEGLIRLYGLTNSTMITGMIHTQLTPLSDGAVLCLQGQNGQFAEITIGEGGSQSAISSVLDTAEAGEKCRGL